MKKIFVILMAFFLCIGIVGCPKKGNNDNTYELSITDGKKVRKSYTLKTGNTVELKPSLKKGSKDVTDKATYTWSIKETGMTTTVSDNGVVTAGNDGDVATVVCTASVGVSANIKIKVTSGDVPDYPDLNGYTITLANAGHALGEYDVFIEEKDKATYGYYAGLDRIAKQNAWKSVEDDFNCKLQVVAYPTDAPWGPSRWAYILEKGTTENPDFDFYVVPDAKISEWASGNAINDLTDWYEKYGQNSMSKMSITAASVSHRLYSINTAEMNIYNILGYNINLFNKIKEVNPAIKEPAQMFLDKEWTYDTFKDYCLACQTILDSLYPSDTEETKNNKHYVLAGQPVYYWVGMLDRNGKGCIDIENKRFNLLTEDANNAATTLREICAANAMDPNPQVDQGVATWNDGKALFNTGDLWFVNAANRWNDTLWGETETSYGYVPFPCPNNADCINHNYVGSTAEACIVMASHKSHPGISDEDVYYAMIEYWIRSKNNYAEEGGTVQEQIEATATNKFGSQASRDAFILVSSTINEQGFYDPMTSNSNAVCGTVGTKFGKAIEGYVYGTGATTWADAVESFQLELNAAIERAFA